MRLSIVGTLYHSQEYIYEFYHRCRSVAEKHAGDDWELVFVNDGSPDSSLEKAVEIANKDDHVVVIDLSRNFGHHKAMMTGLMYAAGEHVFLIDTDLEEEPEWLNAFADLMKDRSCDVVYGVQSRRKGGLFERISGSVFYALFRKASGLDFPANIVTARLMTQRYVQALILHTEREIFLAGIWHITGFLQVGTCVNKGYKGNSTYTFPKKLQIAIDSITSFSVKPLIMMFHLGVFISGIALIYIAFIVAQRLFFTQPQSGWTSVVASVWLFGGLIISFQGILGLYIAKVFSEAKQRPYTVIREIYRKRHG